ncbi:MAG: HYR domain-containing protein [Bacteroidota bacterium]
MYRIITIILLFILTSTCLLSQVRWNIADGNVVQSGGFLVLQDASFYNDGTYRAEDGYVVLNGSGADALSIIGGDSITTFYGLEIHKSANNALLEQKAIVAFNLNLTGGLLDIQNDSLRLLSSADITGASSATYVRTSGGGYLIIPSPADGSAVVFPVGNAAYNPLSLANAGTQDTFGVRVRDEILEQNESGTAISEAYIDRTWDVFEELLGGSDLDLILQWNALEELTNFERDEAEVVRFDNGTWVGQTSNPTTGSDPYQITSADRPEVGSFSVNSVFACPAFTFCPTYPDPFFVGANNCIATISFTRPTVDPVCTNVTVTASITDSSGDPVVTDVSGPDGDYAPGDYNIIWRAVNTDGDEDFCTAQVFTVLDNTNPTISSCPMNMAVGLNADCELVIPNLLSGITADDNCSVVLTQSPQANSSVQNLDDGGTQVVTITAMDPSGNTNDPECNVILTAINTAAVSISPAPDANEGDSGTTDFTFTVTRTGPSCAFDLDFTTSDGTATAGSDYLAQNGTLNFAAGEMSKTITITINGDIVTEGDETFSVTISNPTNGVSLGTATVSSTIENDDTAPTEIANLGKTIDEGATANVILQAELEYEDAEQGPADIIYTLDIAPNEGTLRNNGAAIILGATFTQADINNGLITYDHNGSEEAADFFRVDISDGAGGVVNDVVFNFTITAVNDAPVVTALGAALNTDLCTGQLALEGAGFSFTDADAGSGALLLTLSVVEGTITVDLGDSGAALTSANGGSSVTIEGTATQLNGLLMGTSSGTLVYTNTSPTVGATALTVLVNDNGNTGMDPGISGDGSSEEGMASQTINLTGGDSVDPQIDCPAGAGTEEVTLTFITAFPPQTYNWTISEASGGMSQVAQGTIDLTQAGLPTSAMPTLACGQDYNVTITFTAPSIAPNGFTVTTSQGQVITAGNSSSPDGVVTNGSSFTFSVPSCAGDVSVDNDPGQCSAEVNGLIATATDACTANPAITHTITGATTDSGAADASGTFSVGTSAVTFTATDAAGNTSNCGFNVIVTDVEAPMAVCQNTTVQLDANGQATITATDIDNGSTDNCAIANLAVSPATFDCTDLGDNTVTLTVTDVIGLTDNCTATVTVGLDDNPTACDGLLTKSIVSTDQIGSMETGDGSSGNERPVLIGEIITYQLRLEVPEGMTSDVSIVDEIPDGLAYVANSATFSNTADNSLTFSNSVAGGAAAGDDLTFDLGTVTNNDNDANVEFIDIQYQVRVVNVVENQMSTTLTNSATLLIEGNSLGDANSVSAVVTEPDVVANIQFREIFTGPAITSGDAGDEIIVRTFITNNGDAPAYDLRMQQQFPAQLVTRLPGATTTGDTPGLLINYNTTTGLFTFGLDRIDAGGDVSIAITIRLNNTVAPLDEITAPATIRYTSLPGPNSDQRTGADGVNGALNDYVLSVDSPVLSVPEPEVAKQIEHPSQTPVADFFSGSYDDSTSDPSTQFNQYNGNNIDLAIGETVNYIVTATFTEGTTPDFRMIDLISPRGQVGGREFRVLELLSAEVIFVGNNLSGNGIQPVGTSFFISDENLDGDGSRSQLWFGGDRDILNVPDGVVDDNDRYIIRLQARVDDEDETGGPADDLVGVSNSDGDVAGNRLQFQWTTMQNGLTTRNPFVLNDIVEPMLAIDKAVTATTGNGSISIGDLTDALPGDEVTYTITLTNTGTSAAYDVELTDNLPTDLDLLTVSSTAGTDNSDLVNDVVSVSIPSILAGDTETITLTVSISNTATFGTIYTNEGTVVSQSQPGSGLDIRSYTDTDLAKVVIATCTAAISGVTITPASCIGLSDGTITIEANCTTCTGILYSIDGGATLTTSNVFTDVSPGTYTPYIEDAGGASCNATANMVTVTVLPDTEAPTIDCPANVVQQVDDGQNFATVINIAAMADDNCPGVSITYRITGATVVTNGSGDASGTQFNLGISTVTYEVTDAAGNMNSCNFTVTVTSVPQIVITDPCACKNNATSLVNGQFDEVIQVTDAVAGETWTVTAIDGLFLPSSPAPPAAPFPIVVGTELNEVPTGTPGLSNYELAGIHIDDIGYSITVSNGTTSLSISNRCWYPNPEFSNLATTYCQTNENLTLMGIAQLGDGTGEANPEMETFEVIRLSDGMTVVNDAEGNAILDFTNLEAGSYRVIYTFDAADDDPDNSHPGCSQSIEQMFEILKVDCGAFFWDGN